jgi:two-component sensor histidine kinase
VTQWSAWLPYVGLLVAFSLLVWHHYHPTVIDFGALALSVAVIIALVGARQVLTLRESREFARSRRELAERKQTEAVLRQARDELERRVQERTRELKEAVTALENEVAQHQEAEARLQMSLDEKEVLLKEVHHRVKNNLQVVSSLLGLQSRKACDSTASDLLRESQGRVRTMALIHQKLYASPDLARIDFRDYLQTLLNSLFDSYRVLPGAVMLQTEVARAWLSIDTAVPCGLIVNELVSNALKHAFPDGRRGCICVRLENLNENTLRLSVEDDGIGLPTGLDYRHTESLGLQLAVTLTNQLDGTMAVDSSRGAAFHITFTTC